MSLFSNKMVFAIRFQAMPTPVVSIWNAVYYYLKEKKCLPSKIELSQIAGHPEHTHSTTRLRLSPDELAQIIIDRNLNGFGIASLPREKSMYLDLVDSKNMGIQTTLSCRLEKSAKSPDTWTPLIEEISSNFTTIGAWQQKNHYLAWQGACVLHDSYENFYGKQPEHLRTYIQQGIPPRPDRVMIDTSLNPGRGKQLLYGISFYPSAEMWLGPDFWQYAKCTKEDVLAADFFLEKRDTPHFLYLKSWPEAFSRPDGEQGRQQQRIWKLFFNEDCEWPPGSGTISDEAVYGPPELMPGYQSPD